MKNIITFGEIMMRLSPPQPQKLLQANELQIHYGGAEANVAIALASLGNEVSFVSKLPDNAVGDSVVSYMKKFSIDSPSLQRGGERLGLYFLEEGTAQRSSAVTYDRKYSSFSTAALEDFNWEEIFQGKDLFHFSGITLALGENMHRIALKAVKTAKELGLLVSFDFNYRAKLWDYGTAKKRINEVLPFVDICFGGELDLTKIMGYSSKFVYDPKRVQTIDQEMFRQFMCDFDITCMAFTARSVENNRVNSLFGNVITKDHFASTHSYTFDITDRVGAGDAFAGTFLHYYLSDPNDMERTLNFATAANVLQHSLIGDAFILEEKDLIDFVNHKSGLIR